jgi:hypothetical protein
MRVTMRWTPVAAAFAVWFSCSPSGETTDVPRTDVWDADGGEGGPCGRRDADGDTIADDEEGGNERPPRDTDGDTTPDYQDADADDDTIPDSIEGGVPDPCMRPRDADGDTTPDYLDPDSDGNGIFDAFESRGDLDGDTVHDASDLDDDGDFVPDVEEIGGNPSAPRDSDGDTTPDYRDVDSDGDTISDRDERGYDTNGDTVPDWRDDDSDGDTIPDAEEAGDADLATPAIDTDEDTVPDYRDADSDADGLSDRMERENGTDPRRGDSDDDGIPDLVEVAAGTDPLDPADNPRARGNFVFIVPYEEEPDPTVDTLGFSTDLQKADVYIAVDTSGSMDGEIANLRAGLRGTIVPGIAARIPDVWLGAGRFEDCPSSSCRNAINNLQDITSDIGAV